MNYYYEANVTAWELQLSKSITSPLLERVTKMNDNHRQLVILFFSSSTLKCKTSKHIQ